MASENSSRLYYPLTKMNFLVTVEAMDRYGETFIMEGEGLLAKALCHEIDHLDGVLFTDKAAEIIFVNENDEIVTIENDMKDI
jgi:peptide deformylase